MNTRSPLDERQVTLTRLQGVIRDGEVRRKSSSLAALQRELRAVREQCLDASRKGDYITQGRLTVQAAKLNQAIAEAQQLLL